MNEFNEVNKLTAQGLASQPEMLGAVETAHFPRQLSFVLGVHQLFIPVAVCIFSLFEVGSSIYFCICFASSSCYSPYFSPPQGVLSKAVAAAHSLELFWEQGQVPCAVYTAFLSSTLASFSPFGS